MTPITKQWLTEPNPIVRDYLESTLKGLQDLKRERQLSKTRVNQLSSIINELEAK